MTIPPTDEALIRRARAGDEAAFQTLYNRYTEQLKARVRGRIGPALRRKVDASDVLQDAYLVALRRLPDFDPKGEDSFGRWLGKIVEYKLREVVRHYAGADKRAIGREVSRAHRPRSGQFRGTLSTPSQRAMAKETEDAVARALQQLRPDDREVIRLLQESQVPLEEAARRLGRTKAATEKLYGRALAKLARELGLKG